MEGDKVAWYTIIAIIAINMVVIIASRLTGVDVALSYGVVLSVLMSWITVEIVAAKRHARHSKIRVFKK